MLKYKISSEVLYEILSEHIQVGSNGLYLFTQNDMPIENAKVPFINLPDEKFPYIVLSTPNYGFRMYNIIVEGKISVDLTRFSYVSLKGVELVKGAFKINSALECSDSNAETLLIEIVEPNSGVPNVTIQNFNKGALALKLASGSRIVLNIQNSRFTLNDPIINCFSLTGGRIQDSHIANTEFFGRSLISDVEFYSNNYFSDNKINNSFTIEKITVVNPQHRINMSRIGGTGEIIIKDEKKLPIYAEGQDNKFLFLYGCDLNNFKIMLEDINRVNFKDNRWCKENPSIFDFKISTYSKSSFDSYRDIPVEILQNYVTSRIKFYLDQKELARDKGYARLVDEFHYSYLYWLMISTTRRIKIMNGVVDVWTDLIKAPLLDLYKTLAGFGLSIVRPILSFAILGVLSYFIYLQLGVNEKLATYISLCGNLLFLQLPGEMRDLDNYVLVTILNFIQRGLSAFTLFEFGSAIRSLVKK